MMRNDEFIPTTKYSYSKMARRDETRAGSLPRKYCKKKKYYLPGKKEVFIDTGRSSCI